jgi:uncharacterized protein YdgA (DUF945 family)
VKRNVLIAGAAAVVVLAASYVGGAWFAGAAAETTLQKQHEWLTGLPYFIVKNRQYERGWFSSTEKTTLKVNPELYRFALEKEGEPLPEFEVTYTQHITHGPLPLLSHFNLHPYKAVVTTDFEFAPATKKLLDKFFGDKTPISIENRIGFDDDGVIKVKVPGFDYEEAISGVKAKWLGLDTTVDYGGDFNRVKIDLNAPGLSGEAKGKGTFDFKNLQVTLDHTRGKTGLMVGQTLAHFDSLDVNLQEGTPLKLRLENAGYTGKLVENGEFIDGTAEFKLAKLVLDGKPYGPAELQASARHLHGPTLAKLGDAFTALQKKPIKRDQFADQLSKLAHDEGMPLLEHDPQLAIDKLEVKLPDGDIHFNGSVGLKGFQRGDIDKPVELVKKLNAKADFKVPRKVVETVIAWQATRMFGGPDSGISQADLDYLAGQFVEGQINRLAEQKLIRVEGDMLAATADLSKGAFTLNGVNVPMPWAASSPAAAEPAK